MYVVSQHEGPRSARLREAHQPASDRKATATLTPSSGMRFS